MSLGPGIPQPICPLPVSRQSNRHHLPSGQGVMSRPMLSGLYRDDGLGKRTA
jgi:hypothetical protein